MAFEKKKTLCTVVHKQICIILFIPKLKSLNGECMGKFQVLEIRRLSVNFLTLFNGSSFPNKLCFAERIRIFELVFVVLFGIST